tara:strand:- start:113975 stop:114976 length:1002 start_codon:yes stop_codon:yes gene_type:complete
MHQLLAATLLACLGVLSLACKDGGECAKAFDKETECSENPEEARKEAKQFRDMAISVCKASKTEPEIKAAIACSKKSSCEEYRACESAARALEDVRQLKEMLDNGKPLEAMQQCSYDLNLYKAVPAVAEICDKAITTVFSDLSDAELRSDLVYSCTLGSEAKEWLAASEPLTNGCMLLLGEFESQATTQRNEGTEYDYSACSSYQDLVKALRPQSIAAAAMLCNEADHAEDYVKAVAEVTKNITENISDVPYECTSFLDDQEELKGSMWYATKSSELAKLCFGDLGKLVLAEVSGYCLTDAKNVHKYASRYSLAESDPQLQELLAKTAAECAK